MWTIGFGRPSVWSRSRIPNPPQNRTTFMSPPPIHDLSLVGATGSPSAAFARSGRDGERVCKYPFASAPFRPCCVERCGSCEQALYWPKRRVEAAVFEPLLDVRQSQVPRPLEGFVGGPVSL